MGPAASGADHVRAHVVASVDHAVAAVAARARAARAHRARRGRGASLTSAVRLAARFAHELQSRGGAAVRVGRGVDRAAAAAAGPRRPQPAPGARRGAPDRRPRRSAAARGRHGRQRWGDATDAGALVDADTCARAGARGARRRSLPASGRTPARALAASGDLVHTGPTGTNVGDLVIGLKLSAAAGRARCGALRGGARRARAVIPPMRLLLIEEDAHRCAHIRQRLAAWRPQAQLVVHSPVLAGALARGVPRAGI